MVNNRVEPSRSDVFGFVLLLRLKSFCSADVLLRSSRSSRSSTMRRMEKISQTARTVSSQDWRSPAVTVRRRRRRDHMDLMMMKKMMMVVTSWWSQSRYSSICGTMADM